MDNFFDSFEDVKIEIKGVRLPEIIIPKHYYKKLNIDETTPNDEFLKILCRSGLEEKGLKGNKEYITRLKYEFEVISEIGFIDYFLLVWDVINYCRENEIPVGRGRGSAAGSLILYLINVTGIDPIENKLIFERFISRARAKSQIIDGIRYIDGDMAPDVDLDICTDRREEVIGYLKEKYSGKFCKLPTISTLATRAVIKDVSKIFVRFSEDEINKITKMIPVKFGQPSSITDSMVESETFKKFADENPDIIECALVLEDMMRQKGSHASAYLIGHDLFDTYLPCEMDGNGEVVCSFDMHYAQKETIKLDLLGLHGVTLIANIEKSLGMKFDNFDPNDPEIYSLSSVGDLPYNLFQVGADANYRVFRQVKPKNWEELSAVIALARPGALAYVGEYCSNEYSDHFGNHELKKILEATHNVPLYQEQALAIAHKVFFFSLEEAELIRRAVGKKKPEEIAKWKSKIYESGEKNNIKTEICDFYWKLLEESANYSFNASHSFSYSYLSALTLHLKYKYPQHFYVESLKMAVNKADSQEHVARIQQELNFFGIKLLPPDLIKSSENFIIEGSDIRYGFSSIKGVSEKALTGLKTFLNTTKTNKFEVFNAAENSKVNVGIVCALIQSGMLSTLSSNRERLVFESQVWSRLTDNEKNYCLEHGEEYDFDLLLMVKNIHSWRKENGKPVAAKTRLETIRKKVEPYKAIHKQNTENKALASYYYEKKLLGYSYSSSLKDVFKGKRPSIQNAMEIKNAWDKANVEGVLEVVETKKGVSARGNKWFKAVLQDETGTFEAMMVGDKYEIYAKKNPDPVAGDIVFLMGQKGPEIIWANSMAIQTHKIYLRLADIK